MKKKITIKEVAALAGVSNSTVSRILTGNAPVRDEVKNKVLRIIKETNYYPNASARALSGRKTNTIGVFLNADPDYHFNDYISMETLRGITSTALEINLRINIIPSSLTTSYDRIVAERQLDGMIVMGLHKSEPVLQRLNDAEATEIPIVLLNYSDKLRKIHSVSFSHHKDTYELTRYLISKGHKEIMFIDSLDLLYVENRKNGFLDAMKESGLNPKCGRFLSVSGGDEGEIGKNTALGYMELGNKPSVIIAPSDNGAISCMTKLIVEGVRVPEDVSIVSVDDIPIARYVNPALTTVKLSGFERGQVAIKTMKSLMDGQAVEQHVFIKSHIVERASLKRLR
jgi:LacI family transcriptional regulator